MASDRRGGAGARGQDDWDDGLEADLPSTKLKLYRWSSPPPPSLLLPLPMSLWYTLMSSWPQRSPQRTSRGPLEAGFWRWGQRQRRAPLPPPARRRGAPRVGAAARRRRPGGVWCARRAARGGAAAVRAVGAGRGGAAHGRGAVRGARMRRRAPGRRRRHSVEGAARAWGGFGGIASFRGPWGGCALMRLQELLLLQNL